MDNNIEILWGDLTKEAQKKVAKKLIEIGEETKGSVKDFDDDTIIVFGHS